MVEKDPKRFDDNRQVLADRDIHKDSSGYNQYALRTAVLMAGNRNVISALALITGWSQGTASRKTIEGDWLRADIKHIMDACRLTPSQVMEIFFTGDVSEEEARMRNTQTMSKEVIHEMNKPSVAKMLDDLRRADEADEKND